MSYKEKPIIKLYTYKNNAFELVALIDDYQEASIEHNYYHAGQFTITINYNIPNAKLFERGLFVQLGNSPDDFGEITSIQDSIGDDGKGSQRRLITGYDARYLLKRRIIKNLNSNGMWKMTAKGELCLRNLIADQCGANAEEKRRLPIINTIPATADAIGEEYSVSEQFTNLYDVCCTIATQSKIGWKIAFSGSVLTLECYEGEDLSNSVFFSTDFESLKDGTFTETSDSYTNAVYIGGKGQNDERDIYEGEDGSPAGIGRFESWDDQSQMTSDEEYEAEALSMLSQYGQTVNIDGNGLAKSPYIFRSEYDIGDSIKINFSDRTAVAQVLSVTERWAWSQYDINFSFGKPQNNLAEQIQLILRKIQMSSNNGSYIDSVKWYTIPTDTEQTKADVTFNTLGFTGAIGNSNRTFTLYFDEDSKTGSKSYTLYVKNLTGSGKLILSTGVSGASDLELPSGNNVASVYVDENGNIISSEFKTIKDVSNLNSNVSTLSGNVSNLNGSVNTINSKIPSNASSSNKLSTQSDVNSAVSSDNRTYLTMVGGQVNYSSSQSAVSFIPLWKGAKVGIAIGGIDFAVNGNNIINCALTIYGVKQLYNCFIQAFQYGNRDAYVAYNASIEDFWIKSLISTQNVQVKVLCYCELN